MGVVVEMAPSGVTRVPMKASHTASQMINGEAVVLDIPGKILRGLNPVGSRIWELVDGQRTLLDIARLVAEEYTRSEIEVLQDVESFLDELAVRGVIEFR
ncbi:MAG TPA: PqqD family protein [Nitrospiria bacterium]|nr:PqqD family protein [Nitrospiria bacterium]